MRNTLLTLLLIIGNIAEGYDFFEPSIECTVIKVHSHIHAFGQSKFPRLYQSINNQPSKETLTIASKSLPGVRPKTIFKTENFEKISIVIGIQNFELELKGKPISRNGVLKVDGKILADVTCH